MPAQLSAIPTLAQSQRHLDNPGYQPKHVEHVCWAELAGIPNEVNTMLNGSSLLQSKSSSKDVQGMKSMLVLMGIHGQDGIEFVFARWIFLSLSVQRGQHFLDEAVLLLSPFF